MPSPLSILPARVLNPRPPIGAPWNPWGLLSVAAILGFIVYSVGWVAPVVVTDGLIRSTAVPIIGGRLVTGSCSSKLFIHMCDLTLSAQGPAGLITRSIHYVFGSFTLGSFTVRTIGDPAHPEWLTTDLGLDYFWDRVVSLLIDLVLMAALLYGALAGIRRTAQLRTWWHKAAMVPAPMTLVGMKTVNRMTVWTVRTDDGLEANWTMPRRAKPFVLGPEDRILGLVQDGGGNHLLPLDSKLKWVALSGAERAAALAAGRA